MAVWVLLLLVPALAGAATMWWRSPLGCRVVAIGTAGLHLLATGSCWWTRPPALFGGWVALDDAGLIVLSLVSLLFCAASVYAWGYLAREAIVRHSDYREGFLFANEPEAVFLGGLQLFLAAMSLVTAAQHFGLLWVAIEATTLASAPLIYFHRHHRSLEATWKYLLICSVGIALAMVGNILLTVAAYHPGEAHGSLLLGHLLAMGHELNTGWLQAAFLFFLVGYGTKIGLAPMHSWLPDAYSESPSLVAALLAGALENCALLGLLRAHQVLVAADCADFSGGLLRTFGLISLSVAAVFLVRQPNYKRMLAYSSIEHMGLVCFAVGVGGLATATAFFHACNHSLIKAALFLTAGNILAATGTKDARQVTGLIRTVPITTLLWVAGMFAITGAPPFGMFLSEVGILRATIAGGYWWSAGLVLFGLSAVFIGMSQTILPMVAGGPSPAGGPTAARESSPVGVSPRPTESAAGPTQMASRAKVTSVPAGPVPAPPAEAWWSLLPSGGLLACALVLGVFVPAPLQSAFQSAGATLRPQADTVANHSDNPTGSAATAMPADSPQSLSDRDHARRDATVSAISRAQDQHTSQGPAENPAWKVTSSVGHERTTTSLPVTSASEAWNKAKPQPMTAVGTLAQADRDPRDRRSAGSAKGLRPVPRSNTSDRKPAPGPADPPVSAALDRTDASPSAAADERSLTPRPRRSTEIQP